MIFGLAMKMAPTRNRPSEITAASMRMRKVYQSERNGLRPPLRKKRAPSPYGARRGARGGHPESPHPQGLRRGAGRPRDARRAVRARALGAEPSPDRAVALSRARARGARAPEGGRRARGGRQARPRTDARG